MFNIRRTLPLSLLALTTLFATAGCAADGNSAGAASASVSPSDSTPADSSADLASLAGRLFFTRTTGNDVQAIYVAIDGEEKQLTSPGDVCCVLRVSPQDDRLLVIPGGDIDPPITGGTIDVNGGDFVRTPLTDPTLNLIPQAWSPDGSRIAFEGWDDSDPARTGAYTARASDGGDLIRVTDRPGSLHDIPLDFSPDGTQLVFYRSMHGDPDPHTDGSLWVANVDGSDPHAITDENSPPADWARWSPDGTRILFASERLSDTGPIWTITPAGTELKVLFEDTAGGFALAPDWSPDGTQIVFAMGASNDEFQHQPNKLYVIDAEGGNIRVVNDTADFKRQLEWVQ